MSAAGMHRRRARPHRIIRLPAGLGRTIASRYRSVSIWAIWWCLLAVGFGPSIAASEQRDAGRPPVVLEAVHVDEIWSAVPVRFCLLTHGDMQYVAYFDSERRMAVVQRKLSERAFRDKTVLPSTQGWDSHNYITMAVDRAGHIHLSGNMHKHPLVYFRTQIPGDIRTLVKVPSMVGSQENQCTYPIFLKDPSGRLVFSYRDGSSGSGKSIYNVYDDTTATWSRLLDTPLTDGKGKMNAYTVGPLPGPDGLYHLSWVWRDTSDAATNHDLSYARSKDLRHWESASGKGIRLPITFDQRELIVDPIPPRGGILNGMGQIGFDREARPVLSYHKYDQAGRSQVYVARFESGAWKVQQVTAWNFRWDFGGGGSLPSGPNAVSVQAVEPWGERHLAVRCGAQGVGSTIILLDEKTLQPVGKAAPVSTIPPELTKVVSPFPEMLVNWMEDRGNPPAAAGRYVLRWETLPKNRDLPRKGPLPKNGPLVVYQIGDAPAE
jgi:hypothetical protein